VTAPVVSTGKLSSGKRILIYGPGGVGKSTLAAQFPKPIFFDPTEGTKNIDTTRFKDASTWGLLLEYVRFLAVGDHGYLTFVIDELTEVERMSHDHTCEKAHKPCIDDSIKGGFGWDKGYKAARIEWLSLINELELLTAKGINVVLLGHSTTERFKNPEGEDYDRFNLSCHKTLAALLFEWCDAYMFARNSVAVAMTEKTKKSFAVSAGDRVLHTVEEPAFWAKNRYGLPDEVPLSYDSLAEAIEADSTEPREFVNEIKDICEEILDKELSALILSKLPIANNNTKLIQLLNYARKRKQQEIEND
jgi:hypothetical protein